jgi:hypothetical protein
MLPRIFSIAFLFIYVTLRRCNAQDGAPEPLPIEIIVPKGRPFPVPEPKRSLPPGVEYANFQDNPFHKNLLPGPITSAVFTPFIPTEEPPEVCVEGVQNINQTWADLLQERLFPNRTSQKVGFPSSILESLEAKSNGSVLSEITLGRLVEYCDPTNRKHCDPTPKCNYTEDLHKRIVFLPDDRQEVLDTWFFPFDTIGVIGRERCTGTLFFITLSESDYFG